MKPCYNKIMRPAENADNGNGSGLSGKNGIGGPGDFKRMS